MTRPKKRGEGIQETEIYQPNAVWTSLDPDSNKPTGKKNMRKLRKYTEYLMISKNY